MLNKTKRFLWKLRIEEELMPMKMKKSNSVCHDRYEIETYSFVSFPVFLLCVRKVCETQVYEFLEYENLIQPINKSDCQNLLPFQISTNGWSLSLFFCGFLCYLVFFHMLKTQVRIKQALDEKSKQNPSAFVTRSFIQRFVFAVFRMRVIVVRLISFGNLMFFVSSSIVWPTKLVRAKWRRK